MILSFISFVFSIYTYLQLIQLNKAEVVVSQDEIKIYSLLDCPTTNSSYLPCDIIDPVVKNLGKVQADDIRLEFAYCNLEDPIKLPKNYSSCTKLWDDGLVGSLSPEESGNFGLSNLFYGVGNVFIGIPTVLIFHLSYSDNLNKNVLNKFYFYKYYIGSKTIEKTPAISLLLTNDFKEICSQLIKNLGKIGVSDKLTEYIDSKCHSVK